MEQFFLALIGFSGGFIVAGGVVALMVGLGIITRFIGISRTAKHIRGVEDAILLGARLSQSFPFSFRSGRGCLQLQDCLLVSLWEAGSWRWQRS